MTEEFLGPQKKFWKYLNNFAYVVEDHMTKIWTWKREPWNHLWKWAQFMLAHAILLPSHRLDAMWSPSIRLLSLTSAFLHSWNRTGSVMLRKGPGCALHQHWWSVEDLHAVFLRNGWLMREDLSPIWCGFVYSDPSKIIVPRFEFSTCPGSALHPSQPLLSGYSTPTNCLLLWETGVTGYQFAELLVSTLRQSYWRTLKDGTFPPLRNQHFYQIAHLMFLLLRSDGKPGTVKTHKSVLCFSSFHFCHMRVFLQTMLICTFQHQRSGSCHDNLNQTFFLWYELKRQGRALLLYNLSLLSFGS